MSHAVVNVNSLLVYFFFILVCMYGYICACACIHIEVELNVTIYSQVYFVSIMYNKKKEIISYTLQVCGYSTHMHRQ